MRARADWTILGLVAALAGLVAAFALRPPHAAPANAPASAFSAGRAMADVQAIARAPHPIGSAQQAQVRAYLLGRMTGLGLAPQARPFADGGVNLLGVLPGADRRTRAVLLMAHYDSVPAGPGGADDGAGVASVLEAARALKATGGLGRDVMVLLTDGEEAGLKGSRAFFFDDPARNHVGVAINLEARGDQGRAAMFQTQRQAGGLIGFLVHGHALTGASSLMPDLYRRLPNDTDLTWALRDGRQGLNFAFFAGLDAYHRPADTPARLDPGALQSLGEQVLAAARSLVAAPALPQAEPDLVYGDILGGPVLAYPAWIGWAVLAAAAALLTSACRRSETSLAGLAGGGAAFFGLVGLTGAALLAAGQLRTLEAQRHLAPLLRHDDWVLASLATIAAGVGLVWLWLARARLSSDSLRSGALAALLLCSAVLQVLASADAFILAWPALLSALAAALSSAAVGRLLALIAAAQALYWTGQMFQLVGQTTPAALAPFLALTVVALLPLVPRPGGWTALAGAGVASLGLALGLGALSG